MKLSFLLPLLVSADLTSIDHLVRSSTDRTLQSQGNPKKFFIKDAGNSRCTGYCYGYNESRAGTEDDPKCAMYPCKNSAKDVSLRWEKFSLGGELFKLKLADKKLCIPSAYPDCSEDDFNITDLVPLDDERAGIFGNFCNPRVDPLVQYDAQCWLKEGVRKKVAISQG